MHTRTRATVILLSTLGLAVISLCAHDKRAHFDSQWASTPIVVDGSPTDWAGPLAPFNDEPLSMAVVNDGDSRCRGLPASDPTVRPQILRQGLIVWFDAGDKDKKKFGLKFPIGAGGSEEEFYGRAQ